MPAWRYSSFGSSHAWIAPTTSGGSDASSRASIAQATVSASAAEQLLLDAGDVVPGPPAGDLRLGEDRGEDRHVLGQDRPESHAGRPARDGAGGPAGGRRRGRTSMAPSSRGSAETADRGRRRAAAGRPSAGSAAGDLERDLEHGAVDDPPRAHALGAGRRVGLALVERDEEVEGVGVEGEADVGGAGAGRRADVAVDDPPDHLVGVVDRERDPQQVLRVDLVAERRRGPVAGRVPGRGTAAVGGRGRAGDQPAGLVRVLGPGVGDDRVADRGRESGARRDRGAGRCGRRARPVARAATGVRRIRARTPPKRAACVSRGDVGVGRRTGRRTRRAPIRGRRRSSRVDLRGAGNGKAIASVAGGGHGPGTARLARPAAATPGIGSGVPASRAATAASEQTGQAGSRRSFSSVNDGVERVEQEQPAGQRVADAEEHLERLVRPGGGP